MQNEQSRRKLKGGLLEVIRDRPPLYLGQRSLSALWIFIQGYTTALHDFEVGETDHVLPLEFHHWLRRRYRLGENAPNIKDMILSRTPDEAAALARFFELYDEFRQEAHNSP